MTVPVIPVPVIPVPVILVTGFLGAGKTTLVNHLLHHADGRRVAAVVNDFGAVNIDAELLAAASDGVVGLANGCICCSLEGDLLRTLATLLRRTPRPEAIVIECSGVADPAGVVRTLMDPVIWREAPLETVLCAVDVTRPELLDDPLFQLQLRAADVVALTRTDLAPGTLRPRLAALRPGALLVDAPNGAIPPALLFAPELPATPRAPTRTAPAADRFETLTWTATRPLSLPRFQAALDRLAPLLARAKGILAVAEHPGRPLLLQLVGTRATLAPAPPGPPDAPPVRLVFIAELGRLHPDSLHAALEPCLASAT